MKRSALTTLALLAAAATAMAAPAWKAELTPSAPGKHPRLAPTSLTYEMSWKGMVSAGELQMHFDPPEARKAGVTTVAASARGKGAASAFFSSRYSFHSELDGKSLRPRHFQATEADSKETSTTTLRFLPDRVESRETTRTHRTGQVETKDKSFGFTPVHDIFSAMLHVRSQPLAPGDRVVTVIQPGDTPYLLRVRCHGREVHAGIPALRLSVGMQKIDRDTLALKPYKKLKKDATLWLSDDAERIPLELRAAVFIGDVRAVLTHHRKW